MAPGEIVQEVQSVVVESRCCPEVGDVGVRAAHTNTCRGPPQRRLSEPHVSSCQFVTG